MATRTKRHPLRTWRGPERPYDLITEGTIAVIVVAVLCILAASLWGSPDGGLTYPGGPKSPAGQAFSAKYWDTNDPSDLAQTAVQELAGGTTTAGYGPPFNQTTGASQEIIGIKPAEIAKAIFGLTLPINTANDFVLAPVSQLAAPSSPAVAAAVSLYKAAGGDLSPGAAADQVASSQQMTWLNNYAKALSATSAKFTPTSITVKAGNYGPVPVIIAAELAIADNGSLDGYFQGSQQQLSTNTTMGTMFFSDGTLWYTIARGPGRWRRPVGRHERAVELPRPGLAVAVLRDVPDPRAEPVEQRQPRPGRRPAHDRVRVPAADVRAVDPGHQPHPPMDPPVQDHLPQVLREHGGRAAARRGPGRASPATARAARRIADARMTLTTPSRA